MRPVDQSRARALAQVARGAHPAFPDVLRGFATTGAARLEADGLPVKEEAWRFTPVNALVASDFVAVPEPGTSTVDPPAEGTAVTFVDGHAIGEVPEAPFALHTQRGEPPGPALHGDDGFAALNRAFTRDGVVLTLPGDARGTFHLVHRAATDHGVTAARHRIRVASGADVQVVEHVLGDAADTLQSLLTDLEIEGGARVRYVRISDTGDGGRQVGQVTATVAEGGVLSAGSFVFGGHTTRIELSADLQGPGAEAELFGLSLLRGRSHADHHVTARHAGPHASSDQVFRSIVANRSQSVYTGTVIVDKGALGTDSNQLHQALLMSDESTVHARPWLEIYADDVKCAHGATVGSLDADSLFYLRQRGLTEAEARGLLMWGFATATVAQVGDGSVHDALQARVRQFLEQP